METDLVRTVYLSKNFIAGDETEQSAELDKILVCSRANNERCGVTGALLFNAGYFAQVLEGPRAEVAETFSRIEKDIRHGHITVLRTRDVKDREFGEWAMAHVVPLPEIAMADLGQRLEKAFTNLPESHDELLDMLRYIIRETS